MLDLDVAQGQREEVWRNGWYPNSTVSAGVLLKTMDALIDELRKLREENKEHVERYERLWKQATEHATANENLAKRVEELESLILDYCGRDTSALRIQILGEAKAIAERRAGRAK